VIKQSIKIWVAIFGFVLFAGSAMAQERYVPGIWVDPDGCEHWVMDDGAEGYMTPHVTRDGIPVCRRGNPCAVMNSDQLFRVDKSYITASARKRLEEFFRAANATAFIIDGHTDSDASDAYNMSLSQRRAEAVAKVARSVGARAQIRWYGERVPVASNSTAAGKRKNRRVEITCVR
jgi:outer membrane protein OmpA-like peptidoglycan-associated protein